MKHLLCKIFLVTRIITLSFTIILAFSTLAVGEESETKEPFYKNINANIEMRLVVESEENDTPWLYMEDIKGNRHKVSKEILINSSDVEGVSIKKERGEEFITLHFHPASWGKVYEVTTRVNHKKVAIVEKGVILTLPRINEPLIKAAQISGSHLASTSIHLNGFSLSRRPSHFDSNERYHQFLSDWISSHPNDLKTKKTLAYSFLMKEKPPQLDKALPLLKELTKANPDDGRIQMELVRTLVKASKLDEALDSAKSALSNLGGLDEISMYGIIAEVFHLKSEKSNALKYLEICLQKVEKHTFPKFSPRREKLKAQVEKITGKPVLGKSGLVNQIKKRIEFIRSH